MDFRFLLLEDDILEEKDLPGDFKQFAPVKCHSIIDLGIVGEDDLFDKLAYFLHGVDPRYHKKIVVSKYPDARLVMSLPDMCKAFGVT